MTRGQVDGGQDAGSEEQAKGGHVGPSPVLAGGPSGHSSSRRSPGAIPLGACVARTILDRGCRHFFQAHAPLGPLDGGLQEGYDLTADPQAVHGGKKVFLDRGHYVAGTRWAPCEMVDEVDEEHYGKAHPEAAQRAGEEK